MNVTNKINLKYGAYHCPWQAIHFIGYRVPKDLRKDMLLSSKELFNIDYTSIFNNFKIIKMISYRGAKIVDAEIAIDQTKVVYDGWYTTIHQTYMNWDGTHSRPFSGNFAIARKEVIAGLWVVSIAITLKA